MSIELVSSAHSVLRRRGARNEYDEVWRLSESVHRLFLWESIKLS